MCRVKKIKKRKLKIILNVYRGLVIPVFFIGCGWLVSYMVTTVNLLVVSGGGKIFLITSNLAKSKFELET